MPKKRIIKQKSIVLFENAPVRRVWSDKDEKWFFAIMDIVEILTGSINPPAYWRKLKERLRNTQSETYLFLFFLIEKIHCTAGGKI